MKHFKLTGIDRYTVINKKLSFVKNNTELYYEGQKIYESSGKIFYTVLSEELIYVGHDGKSYLLRIGCNFSKLEVPQELNCQFNSFSEKDRSVIAVVFDNVGMKRNRIGRFFKVLIPEFKKFDLGFSFKHKVPITSDEKYFFIDANIVFKYRRGTQDSLWQYDTSVLGIEKIGKILGVFGEVLVVVGVYENPDPRYSDQYELYMGLDIITGHLLWQQKEVLINQKMSPLGGLSFNLQFKKDSLLLEALLGDYYWKLNSQTGEIKAESIKEQLDEKGIDVTMSSSISDTHLYFKAHVLALGGFAKCIGSFDTQSLKIDWLHIFEDFQETGAFIRNAQPKISGNKVYALDYNNTLHIFERE